MLFLQADIFRVKKERANKKGKEHKQKERRAENEQATTPPNRGIVAKNGYLSGMTFHLWRSVIWLSIGKNKSFNLKSVRSWPRPKYEYWTGILQRRGN